jgi:hypothetical protein
MPTHAEDALCCCPCCGQDAKRHAHEERREILLLTVCGILFALTLLFEEAVEERLGACHVAAYALPYLICGMSIIRAAGRAVLRGDFFNELWPARSLWPRLLPFFWARTGTPGYTGD